MAPITHRSFKQTDALANAAATAWLDEIAAAHQGGTPHCVALSGGRIARKLYAAVVERAKTRNIPLSRVHFFWADERCVPAGDAESNYRLARERLFNPLRIGHDQIHRVRGELDPTAAARDAEAAALRIVPLAQDGQPVFDLILLGMGEDGHVASLFPGEPAAVTSNRAVYRAVIAPKPPPWRVTLGHGVIAAAREVWVLVSGEGKEEALRESLRPAGQTPLARVLRSRAHTRIFDGLKSRC